MIIECPASILPLKCVLTRTLNQSITDPLGRRPRHLKSYHRFRNQTASFEVFESIWNAVSSHVDVRDSRPISVNSDCPRANPGSSQIKSSISSQSWPKSRFNTLFVITRDARVLNLVCKPFCWISYKVTAEKQRLWSLQFHGFEFKFKYFRFSIGEKDRIPRLFSWLWLWWDSWPVGKVTYHM